VRGLGAKNNVLERRRVGSRTYEVGKKSGPTKGAALEQSPPETEKRRVREKDFFADEKEMLGEERGDGWGPTSTTRWQPEPRRNEKISKKTLVLLRQRSGCPLRGGEHR